MITITLLRQCKAKLFFGCAIAEPKKLSRADFLSRPGELFLVHSTNENPQIHDNSQFVIVFFLVLHVSGLASDLCRHVSRYSVPDWRRDCERQFCRQERKMDLHKWTCVIDLFGKNYDGTMPSIVFACDETWLGLFPVAPPNPPVIESGDRPDGRLFFS